MVYIAEYDVCHKNKIRIKVDETERGFVDASPGIKILRTNQNFEDIISDLEPVINAFRDKIQSFESKPKNVSVEFGLKFMGKSGAIIASAGVEAQFKITVTWEGMS